MSGSSDRAATNTSLDNTSPYSTDVTPKKKSILLNPEYKRGSSKVTIQWEENVKGQRLEEGARLDRRSRLQALGHLMSRGSKWNYIQELMSRLKADEGNIFKFLRISEEDSQGRMSPKRIDSLNLARELWNGMLQKVVLKGADLTLDQQTKLELFKHKIKSENDKYLKNHPELDILLSLVYRKLLRTKPPDPKMFVANYVHYLNAHREELVLDEVDVPFDRVPVTLEEPTGEDDLVDERLEIEVFARALVEKCAELASCGSAEATVTSIIDSMLDNVDGHKNRGSSLSLNSAERAVRGVLMSVLTSVAHARTRSAEIVVEEVLDSVFDSVCPAASRDGEDFVEMRESVERFVRSLLKTVTDKFTLHLRRQARLDKFEKSVSKEDSSISADQDATSITSKSILKKIVTPKFGAEDTNIKSLDKPEIKSKVKFQSMSFVGDTSKEPSNEENISDK